MTAEVAFANLERAEFFELLLTIGVLEKGDVWVVIDADLFVFLDVAEKRDGDAITLGVGVPFFVPRRVGDAGVVEPGEDFVAGGVAVLSFLDHAAVEGASAATAVRIMVVAHVVEDELLVVRQFLVFGIDAFYRAYRERRVDGEDGRFVEDFKAFLHLTCSEDAAAFFTR